MEYRSFEYTNDLNQVELKRGSLIGIAVSWILIQSLKVALILVAAGLAFSIFKYLDPTVASAKALDPYSPAAVYSSSVPPLDYSVNPMLPAQHRAVHTLLHPVRRG